MAETLCGEAVIEGSVGDYPCAATELLEDIEEERLLVEDLGTIVGGE
jgi:hypothetical protein